MRNYDGLGGQLLFAYLHRRGYLHWTDNRLTIEWDRVAEGVAALRDEVQELYRDGDRPHQAPALVRRARPGRARTSRPRRARSWVAGVRDFEDVEDPRPYVDLVLDDEFPLSIFYTSLKS